MASYPFDGDGRQGGGEGAGIGSEKPLQFIDQNHVSFTNISGLLPNTEVFRGTKE